MTNLIFIDEATVKLALEVLKIIKSSHDWTEESNAAIKALEEALAKQEQGEPVAWMDEIKKESHKRFKLPTSQSAFQAGALLARQYIYTTPQQRKPLTAECCTWKNYDDFNMPDTWESDCGAMWTFTEGGPKDNDMKFCPNCGKPTIEAAHGIKG